jgi:predicted glycoside hydrolase/deacetylase ChbG (UPF0249 family)
MKIIVNCDDLGASTPVNDSIFDLMQQGRVTSATLMMNGAALEDALGRIGTFRQCSFGVHLNVTEFAPLSTHPGLLPLLNAQGEFAGNAQRRPREIPLNASIREGVYAEWCAQIERALALGVPVSHLDSHHHVHTRPSLLGILKRVQERYGIRRVRLRANLLSLPISTRKRISLLRQVAWNAALRGFAGAETCDAFAAFSVFHARLLAGFDGRGAIELMCHPGREQYAAETELLRGPWKDRLAPDARLIGYNELS